MSILLTICCIVSCGIIYFFRCGTKWILNWIFFLAISPQIIFWRLRDHLRMFGDHSRSSEIISVCSETFPYLRRSFGMFEGHLRVFPVHRATSISPNQRNNGKKYGNGCCNDHCCHKIFHWNNCFAHNFFDFRLMRSKIISGIYKAINIRNLFWFSVADLLIII